MRRRALMLASCLLVAGALSGQDRVVNGSFDSNTSSWQSDPRFASFTTLQWTSVDGNGAAEIVTASADPGASYVYSQCMAVSPGEALVFRGRLRRPSGQASQGNGWIFLYWYKEANCLTGSAGFGAGAGPTSDDEEAWQTYGLNPLTVPPDARGAVIGLIVGKYSTGGSYRILFDDLTLLGTSVAPAISITGPSAAVQNTPVTFAAAATNCQPGANGWTWVVTGGTISGSSTGPQVSVNFGNAGNASVTATNSACGSATVTVPVAVSPQAPDIVVSSLPLAMVQYATLTGGATRYILTNRGGSTTTVTLSADAPFFVHDSSAVTIGPGLSQFVYISGRAQPQGPYQGNSRISGAGVPGGLSVAVSMASTGIPIGPTAASASGGQTEVNGPPGTNPTGSVTFRNDGTVLLEGVVSTDVPWLILATTFVSIPVGQSVQVNFTIDLAAKAALGNLGSGTATIVLRFPRSPFFLKQSEALTTAQEVTPPATSRTAAAVVATATTPLSSAAIPPFGIGDFALVVPLIGGADARTDLTLGGQLPSTSIAGANMYLLPVGGSSASLATLPTFGPNPLSYSNITKNLFQQSTPTGSLQIRSASNDSVVPSATLRTSASGSVFTSVLPVFRSDRASGSEDTITLPGLRKDQSVSTDLYLQELAGFTANASLEFRSDSGAVVSSTSRDLTAFGVTSLIDAVPAGATQLAVRVSGSGRATVYAVTRHTTGERAVIADWRRVYGVPATEPLILPIVAARRAGPGIGRYDLQLSNRAGSGTATITADLYRQQSRSRGAIRGSRGVQTPLTKSWTVPAGTNRLIRDVALEFGVGSLEGHLTLKATGGDVTMIAEGIDTSTGDDFPTIAVPLLPLSIAKANGVVSPFTFDDSPLTEVPRNGTLRTDLGLIETAGAEARVRITLNYPQKTSSASVPVPSTEFVLAPNQSLTVEDIVATLVGLDKRAELGDLYGATLKAQLVSGGGRVLTYLIQHDNATEQLSLRPPYR
ncbi:MAG: PKD domain-containing protein [Acidobacteriota bacterium]